MSTPYQVSANSRLYTVVDDCAPVFFAMIVGAVSDEILGTFDSSSLQVILQGAPDQLRVALEALSLEDLSLVWDALSEPYQLSVSYVVQTVSIDSALEPVNTMPVLEKQTVYSKILSMQ